MGNEMDEFNKKLSEDQEISKAIELDKRKKVLAEKDLTLKEHRVGLDLTRLIQNTNELEQAKSIRFGEMPAAEVESLIQLNDDYMEAAKKSMIFINDEFKGIVPFFRKNIILVLADTGDGKSTAVANIAFQTITTKNPCTGKSGRVLVLTNEEASEDFYNRVTCLIKGWNYTKHNEFTDEHRKTFREFIPKLSKDGRLTVIGDTYQGIPGWTRTVEGIEMVFNNMIRDNDFYDVILIDYYQNITTSKMDPMMDINKCQAKVADILDRFKNVYPAPIVIMAQINRLKDEEDTTPYNVRIKGRKIICDKATFICELIPERKILRSSWVIRKSRFTGTTGDTTYTGFDRGRFVPYSKEYQLRVAKIVHDNMAKDELQKLPASVLEEKKPNEV